LVGWLVGWLVGLVGLVWLVGWLVVWLFGSLVGWYAVFNPGTKRHLVPYIGARLWNVECEMNLGSSSS